MEVFVQTNLLRLQQNFARWSEKVGDLEPAFKLFIPQFQKSRTGWIMAGRSVEGQRHAALSPAYKLQKDRLYGPRPILVASGRMLNAIKGGEGWKQRVTSKELEIIIDVNYASYHQDGTRKMAQRNYFLTKNGTLTMMDYAQLIQAMEGQIDIQTEAILNQSLADMARGL